MLNEQIREFNDAIMRTAAQIGKRAPEIADAILAAEFPRTCREAHHEGAYTILRQGAISHISRLLKRTDDETGQHDLADIDPEFGPFVEVLKSRSYYVTATGEYVSVGKLIDQPEFLDDARKHMRQKGIDCLAEAERLDQLYHAVMAAQQTDDAIAKVFV